jgi:hypothetical protein
MNIVIADQSLISLNIHLWKPHFAHFLGNVPPCGHTKTPIMLKVLGCGLNQGRLWRGLRVSYSRQAPSYTTYRFAAYF